MKRYDAVVIGLGVTGAATLWDLAKSGANVLGMDSSGPTHASGSSHGGTRIFRRAYWEGEQYLPLLGRAHEGWMALQSTTEDPLLAPTGGVFIGPRASGVTAGSLRAAIAGTIPHESLDALAIRQRFPAFQVTDNMEAVYESDAYAVAAEQARLHMLNEAVGGSATIWHGERACSFEESDGTIQVSTQKGSAVSANALVVAAGPWIGDVLPELQTFLSPRRVPVYWFEPRPGHAALFDAQTCPVFLYECEDGSLLYGVPSGVSTERGVKIGFHNRQQAPSSPDEAAPNIDRTLKEQISERVREIFPALRPDPIRAKWCFYTMSKDESFIMGKSERYVNVFYVSACSGHGFKFAPAIGEAMSCFAKGEKPPVDISQFALRRFQ